MGLSLLAKIRHMEIGGWELSGAAFLTSVPPISVVGLNPPIDPAGLGLFTPWDFAPARPDRVGDPNKGAPRTLAQWFNTSVFANPPADGLRPGNAPVTSIHGPSEIRWDAAVLKNTKSEGHFNLEFRVEPHELGLRRSLFFRFSIWPGTRHS